jgi:hypothetical protein
VSWATSVGSNGADHASASASVARYAPVAHGSAVSPQSPGQRGRDVVQGVLPYQAADHDAGAAHMPGQEYVRQLGHLLIELGLPPDDGDARGEHSAQQQSCDGRAPLRQQATCRVNEQDAVRQCDRIPERRSLRLTFLR